MQRDGPTPRSLIRVLLYIYIRVLLLNASNFSNCNFLANILANFLANFSDCKFLSNDESPGPDGIVNELLKMLPHDFLKII